MNLERIRVILYYCCQPIRPKDLKQKVGFSEMSIFRLLNHCAEMGLVKREGERRNVTYSTTDLGSGVLKELSRRDH